MATAVADGQIAQAVRAVEAKGQVRIRVDRPVTGEYLCELGRRYELWRFEAGRKGEIVITAPPGRRTTRIETKLARQVGTWEETGGYGEASGGNDGYDPPGGRPYIPDVSWISPATKARYEAAGSPTSAGFAVLVPDFVIEVRSRSQTVSEQQEKMEDWRTWGVALGLLVDPESQTVYLYRPGREPEVLKRPETVSCEPEMPGLALDFSEIWTLPWP